MILNILLIALGVPIVFSLIPVTISQVLIYSFLVSVYTGINLIRSLR